MAPVSAIGCGAMVARALRISCKAACPRSLPSISIRRAYREWRVYRHRYVLSSVRLRSLATTFQILHEVTSAAPVRSVATGTESARRRAAVRWAKCRQCRDRPRSQGRCGSVVCMTCRPGPRSQACRPDRRWSSGSCRPWRWTRAYPITKSDREKAGVTALRTAHAPGRDREGTARFLPLETSAASIDRPRIGQPAVRRA